MIYRTVCATFTFTLMLVIAGCTTSTPVMEPPAFNLTGVWQGETRVIPCGFPFSAAERCNAVNRITFAIRQDGAELHGDYTCGIGNAVCRDANRTTNGTIVHGSVSGNTLAMRVFLPGDLSSCMYNGQVLSATEARGGYRCYQGGGLVEQGLWNVSRQETAAAAS